MSSQQYRENLRKKRRELDVSGDAPAEAAEKVGGEPEQPSRRSVAIVRGQKSQRRTRTGEDDGQQRLAKHCRDGSAPPSEDASREQRKGTGGPATPTSPQDEAMGQVYAQDSFAARAQQPSEPAGKFSTIISVTAFPVTDNDGDPPSVAAPESLVDQVDELALIPSPALESGPSITAAMVQHATAPSPPNASSDNGPEYEPHIIDSVNAILPTFDRRLKAPEDLEDFNGICQDLVGIIELQEKKLKDGETKLHQHQQQNTALQQQIADLQQQNSNLLNNQAQLEEEINDLEIRTEDLQDLLASKATSTTNHGASLIPDTEVEARWISLCFDIRQCVTDHVRYSGNHATIHKSVFFGLHSPSLPHEGMFVRDTEGCRLIAQAVIWRILGEYVFGNRTRMSRMFWAGKFSEGVRCLSDGAFETCDGQTELKAFHSWRRQTATFLSTVATREDAESHTESVLAITQDMLKCFLPMPWDATLRGKVKDIITSAIRLDCDLSQQWAYWYVEYPNRPVRQGNQVFQGFDSDLMKGHRSQDGSQVVALMISPALLKAGDSRGQGYMEQVEVRCKCEVICDDDPRARPRPFEWSDWTMPEAVPLVADHKTERLRKQQKQASASSDMTANPGRKFLGWMGIGKTD